MRISHSVELPKCLYCVGVKNWTLMPDSLELVFWPYSFLAG